MWTISKNDAVDGKETSGSSPENEVVVKLSVVWTRLRAGATPEIDASATVSGQRGRETESDTTNCRTVSRRSRKRFGKPSSRWMGSEPVALPDQNGPGRKSEADDNVAGEPRPTRLPGLKRLCADCGGVVEEFRSNKRSRPGATSDRRSPQVITEPCEDRKPRAAIDSRRLYLVQCIVQQQQALMTITGQLLRHEQEKARTRDGGRRRVAEPRVRCRQRARAATVREQCTPDGTRRDERGCDRETGGWTPRSERSSGGGSSGDGNCSRRTLSRLGEADGGTMCSEAYGSFRLPKVERDRYRAPGADTVAASRGRPGKGKRRRDQCNRRQNSGGAVAPKRRCTGISSDRRHDAAYGVATVLQSPTSRDETKRNNRPADGRYGADSTQGWRPERPATNTASSEHKRYSSRRRNDSLILK